MHFADVCAEMPFPQTLKAALWPLLTSVWLTLSQLVIGGNNSDTIGQSALFPRLSRFVV